MRYRVAIDIGGTFTDLVAEDETGGLSTTKVLSTPPDLVTGVVEALRESAIGLEAVEVFVHGTTQGLNALLERRGALVALVTTAGFRDTYLLGRGHRPDMYNLHYRKPEPLLGRDATFEVVERLAADGAELTPLDDASVREAADGIRAGGHTAVAVCLLHSYANASHEVAVRRRLEELLPGVCVVTSSDVAPEWREYERTSTTVMSAYITPIMRAYLESLENGLAEAGLRVPVYINESNGGVMVARLAAEHAIGTLLSGPVGGVIGTAALSELLGIPDLISADVGGTSFDVSIVRDGKPALRSEYELQELPVLAPSVEVHTIGAGGGSLISVDAAGRLRVGPESAGAVPGPAAYARGGTQPTVTDAHVALGRIPTEQRLGGSLSLDASAAREAVAAVAAQLALEPVDLAQQSLQVVNFRMAEAIRELTVERGLDPRGFALVFFGGAGGLHAVDVAEELEITRIVIPALPGSFSAAGMLKGGVRHDFVRSFFRDQQRAATELPGVIELLRERAVSTLAEEGIPEHELELEFFADVRYAGQEYSLTVPVRQAERFELLVDDFQDAYHGRYGHSSPGSGIELVAVRATAGKRFEQRGAGVPADAAGTPIGEQLVHFAAGSLPAPVYRREDVIGLDGPALIIEATSTTVVPPGWRAVRLPAGHLLLERSTER
ncbi:MAG: hydantoinase/oxoprolinase family protein [Microbacteriaceae bacterium]